MSKDLPRFSIIGFGAFGSLWAKLLDPFGTVKISSRSMKSGIKQVSLKEALASDFVFLSVPMRETEKTIRKIGKLLKTKVQPWPVIIDVCSVKVLPALWLKNYLPKTCEFLPMHPMFGPQSAAKGIKGLQLVICPKDGRISQEKLEQLKKIFKKMAFEIIEITAQEHDKQSAVSLAFVHYLGRIVQEIKLPRPTIRTKGWDHLEALKDHVANNSWELFIDLQQLNIESQKWRRKIKSAIKIIDQAIDKKATKD